jgi:medium-chain acyl-[acyl-carrier-protein] hydrolase
MARVRLVCFPHAGAGALAYRRWSNALPAEIESFAAQAPGREDRGREAPFTGWRALVDAAVEALGALRGLPIGLYGHSLGAIQAFEVARGLSARGASPPVALVVSGHAWPGRKAGMPRLSALPDSELLVAMENRYGAPHAPAFADPEIRAATLPTLRADLALLEAYTPSAVPRLACPIVVHAGDDDPSTRGSPLGAWGEESSVGCRVRMFAGAHFFNDQSLGAVLRDVAGVLGGA